MINSPRPLCTDRSPWPFSFLQVIRIDHEQNSLEVAFKTIYLHAQPLISVKNTRPGKLVWGIMREKLTSGVRVEFENDISGVLHTRAMGKESMRLYYKRFVPDTGVSELVFHTIFP